MFLSVSAVCASDVNETDNAVTLENDDIALSDDVGDIDDSPSVVNTTSKTPPGDVFVKDYKYGIKIADRNGTAVYNKTVKVTFNGVTSTLTTNKNGYVYLKLTSKGTHTLSFLFNESGYLPVSQSKKITVVDNSKSTIKGSNYVAYVNAKNPYSVTLTTGGVKLPNKKVTFTINGKKYVRTTDSNGKATLDINLNKGTYEVKYQFNGVTNAKSAKGSSKITVKKGMPTTLTKMFSLTFYEKQTRSLKFKYVDARGEPIHGQKVFLTVNSKTYTQKTDKNGMVVFKIKLNKGIYGASVSTYNTKVYTGSHNYYHFKVKPNYTVNNGFWLFGSDMKSVNLKELAKNGVNQIFLNYYAVTLHGKSGVSDFATKADKYGINVHIWMLTFYDGSWISPVTSSGKYKYSYFNSVIKKAKEYASIKGIDGIHFDYLRCPGNAYKYKNAASAINYFTKQACNELHKQNPKIIVSAAVMAEPAGMKYYYGQDIPTISKYLDVIIPMVYKGNYRQGSSWIQSTTAQFVKMSNGAQIWTGLQGYYSDSYVKKLPTSNIKYDAEVSSIGGAQGVIIFRYTLFNLFDFNTLK